MSPLRDHRLETVLNLHLINNRFEAIRLIHAQVSQHLPVYLYVGVGEAVHESRVVYAMLSDYRADGVNPSTPKLAGPQPARDVCVAQSPIYCRNHGSDAASRRAIEAPG